MTAARQRQAGVVWSRVEDDFHVASQRGEFIGYIDRQGGVFLAYDERPDLVGRFPTLPLAMTAVMDARTLPADGGLHSVISRPADGWIRKGTDD